MATARDRGGDLGEMQVHRLGIADWEDQIHRFVVLRADCTKDIGGGSALIF
jgi:hypothetical protein